MQGLTPIPVDSASLSCLGRATFAAVGGTGHNFG
jgi:hypothetical protein